jgi:hypothetical protein
MPIGPPEEKKERRVKEIVRRGRVRRERGRGCERERESACEGEGEEL